MIYYLTILVGSKVSNIKKGKKNFIINSITKKKEKERKRQAQYTPTKTHKRCTHFHSLSLTYTYTYTHRREREREREIYIYIYICIYFIFLGVLFGLVWLLFFFLFISSICCGRHGFYMRLHLHLHLHLLLLRPRYLGFSLGFSQSLFCVFRAGFSIFPQTNLHAPLVQRLC